MKYKEYAESNQLTKEKIEEHAADYLNRASSHGAFEWCIMKEDLEKFVRAIEKHQFNKRKKELR